MKAALTLKGGPMWPAQTKARTLGVDRLGWEADDPQIDPALNGGVNVIEPVRANGFSIFLFRARWGWDGSPEGWADSFVDDLHRLDHIRRRTLASSVSRKRCERLRRFNSTGDGGFFCGGFISRPKGNREEQR